MTSDYGILACGSYVPRGRLSSATIAAAHGWYQPSLKSAREAQRSFCNWDEDALTMAVEASRNCIDESDTDRISRVHLSSTSLPFADRSNAGVLREALDIPPTAQLTDTGGSMRAASTTLTSALADEADGLQLVTGADCLDSKPASADESQIGHASAAVLVGSGDPIAVLLGSASLHQDFVDHYRATGERFAYSLEARWSRDAGYRDQVGDVFAQALAAASVQSVDQLYVAAPAGLAHALAKMLGHAHAGAGLLRQIGYCGAAQPLLLLNHALASAKQGNVFAVVSTGHGLDISIFEVRRETKSVSLLEQIADGVAETNYCRYLSLRSLLEIEKGIRAERDNRTAQSAFWRKHDAITGFKGGQCRQCGTLQFPASTVCVSCGAQDSQTLCRIADMQGTVRSFTEDWLAFTPKPPLVFGNVGFESGLNVSMEFTDVEAGQIAVGMPVVLRFRIKDVDERRGFQRYFWKPTPVTENQHG